MIKLALLPKADSLRYKLKCYFLKGSNSKESKSVIILLIFVEYRKKKMFIVKNERFSFFNKLSLLYCLKTQLKHHSIVQHPAGE